MSDADTTDGIEGWLSLVSIVAALLFVFTIWRNICSACQWINGPGATWPWYPKTPATEGSSFSGQC